MKLSPEEIEKQLERLAHWKFEENKIVRHLQFDTFMLAIAFINRIAPLAEVADHHPEIFNVYNRVELVLTTHDCSGLSLKDFALAEEINRIV